MRNRNTIEYLGLWEMLNNPGFNPIEFEGVRSQAGLNAFTLSPSRWIELTNAIGIVSTTGRYGGTYAQRDIAFKFASWVSAEFELYLIKEFQRLKEEEQKALGWSAKRELAKINYHIHTDAIKANLVPQEIDTYHKSLIYANEADVLNLATRCITTISSIPRISSSSRTMTTSPCRNPLPGIEWCGNGRKVRIPLDFLKIAPIFPLYF